MDEMESSDNSSTDERTLLLNNEMITVINKVELVSRRASTGKYSKLQSE